MAGALAFVLGAVARVSAPVPGPVPEPEPAPLLTITAHNVVQHDSDSVAPYASSRSVSVPANVTLTGGDGDASVSYARVSGDGIGESGGVFSAVVTANDRLSAVFRATASDSSSSDSDDFTVTLSFTSGTIQ